MAKTNKTLGWMQISLKTTLISALTLVGCTNKKTASNQLSALFRDSQNIISTRPQNSSQFMAVLKLKNQSLMQSVQKQNGKAVIDSRLLKEILTEQEQTIASLKALSPEIQIVYRYKMVLNGLAILAPIEFQDKLKGLGQIAYSERVGNFERPRIMELTSSASQPAFLERNSSQFVGAEKLNNEGVTGKGIKVGIIDTGIDYTHAMFKGEGTEQAYKAVDPDKESAGFPNDRVVGGVDLVGTSFDSASPNFTQHIPKPDVNPLDQGGHGTHVAGTVAGIGDQVHSYNGMAPEASLYAIKVFGAEGSTSDSVVIAALEYAADPNADGDNSDQLDIVNLSLGSGYGNPHILYSEAIKNLVNGGTVVVASAGNSGHADYIVGAPGTTTEALSVAASVDNGDQNWKFNSSKILIGSGASQQKIIVEAIEASLTKKIADAGNVSGKFVYLGLAAQDLTEDQQAAVKGNVALIDRGQVTFNDKIKRAAAAGAIGVVVMNNSPGSPIAMGTSEKFDIPAIMIGLEEGKKIKQALKNPDAEQAVAMIEFLSSEKIEKPELIDTLTDFSSKGPRSVDGFLKPEISAPGSNVISAKMGGGAETVQMSGTSMAAPHMSGIMALIKQAHPELSAEELKSIAMGTSKTIGTSEKRYPVSMQGAGRVQADKAAYAKLVVEEPSISLGEMAVETKKVVRKVLHVKNLSEKEEEFQLQFEGNGFIQVNMPTTLKVPAQETVELKLDLVIDATKMKDESIVEMDGWVKLKSSVEDASEVYRVPVLAIAHKLSAIQAGQLQVQATSDRDSAGALAHIEIKNLNNNPGQVMLFNLIGQDDRKPFADSYMTSDCDLQSAGYRLVKQKNQQGQDELVLQVAIKTYKPMTTWNSCDVSLLIDADQDGIPDQELIGSSLKSIPGLIGEDFASTLLDATKAREIRKQFEVLISEAKNDPKKIAELKDKENYTEAVLDQKGMTLFNNSTVVVLEAAVSALKKTREGNLAFNLVVTHNEQSSVMMDDYLLKSSRANKVISLKFEDQAFADFPEDFVLSGKETKNIDLTKGSVSGSLLVLFPGNKFSTSDVEKDSQAQILKPVYRLP